MIGALVADGAAGTEVEVLAAVDAASPSLLLATTAHEYEDPTVNPVTVIGDALALALRVVPPLLDVHVVV